MARGISTTSSAGATLILSQFWTPRLIGVLSNYPCTFPHVSGCGVTEVTEQKSFEISAHDGKLFCSVTSVTHDPQAMTPEPRMRPARPIDASIRTRPRGGCMYACMGSRSTGLTPHIHAYMHPQHTLNELHASMATAIRAQAPTRKAGPEMARNTRPMKRCGACRRRKYVSRFTGSICRVCARHRVIARARAMRGAAR